MAHIRATGRGYNARVEKALREAFAKPEHAPLDASREEIKATEEPAKPEPAAKPAAAKRSA